MTDYTKGEWRIHEQAGWEQDDDILIESVQVNPAPKGQKRTTPIATMTLFDAEANAHLIAATVNACIKLNPDNPQAVSESIPKLYEACKLACCCMSFRFNSEGDIDVGAKEAEHNYGGGAAYAYRKMREALASVDRKGEGK